MNKKLILYIAIGIFLGVFIYTSFSNVEHVEIENSPDWLSLQQAQEVAMVTDKLIFVDVYEIGCKYCRAMDREVFPDSTVRQVMDRDYVPVRLNGNSRDPITFNGEQIPVQEFTQSKGAYAYPTSLILDARGNVIKRRTGYMNVDEFRQFLYR
ncbi:MAG: thioredoxin family protein [Balneolaceae bacterium]|nr:thioredoxin family protein [Balneolaceae bacterium]